MDPNTNPPILFHWLDRILVALALALGCLALAGMTVLSVWNVLIMRKALNSPIKGAEDVLIVTLVAIVAISIPLGARTGAHIEIEVLESRMSRSFAKWSHVVIKVLCIALLLVMSWRLWHAGQSAVRFGETTQQLMISYEPFYYLMGVSVLLYAVVLVRDVWELLQGRKVVRLDIGRNIS
jgi:TRAP-type C4-dicarboxylate transport system permease small subunit